MERRDFIRTSLSAGAVQDGRAAQAQPEFEAGGTFKPNIASGKSGLTS
jgi:hypothetical protein